MMVLTFSDDYDGLRSKIQGLGYNGSREDDEKVIQALVGLHLTLESQELSKDAREAVVDLLAASVREELNDLPDLSEDSWKDFDYGNVKVDDFVRVKPDAYDSGTGSRHNGLVGILVAMRGGQCVVRYIGRASGNTMRHPMDKLDSLKRV